MYDQGLFLRPYWRFPSNTVWLTQYEKPQQPIDQLRKHTKKQGSIRDYTHTKGVQRIFTPHIFSL